jgi:hypothetical protein
LLDSLWKLLQLLQSLAILVPDGFCMKNRNVKNLDLWYLKIHESSVPNFWICCVFGYLLNQKLHKVMLYIVLYKLFSIYAESVQMIFVAKNNYVFVPNFCMLSFDAKMHLWWINHNFIINKNIYSWNMLVFLCKCITQDP